MNEQRRCNECGEERNDTGFYICLFCSSADTEIVERDEMTKFYMDGHILKFHGSLETDSLRQAILWSIEKFKVMAVHLDGGGDYVYNHGSGTCALCVYSENKSDGLVCCAKKCPIYQENENYFGCGKTPYDDFARNQTAHNARREAEFLRGFLSEVVE